MVGLLDMQDALPSARRLHDWAIEAAAVRPEIRWSISAAAPER
jgi:hypothetical protein